MAKEFIRLLQLCDTSLPVGGFSHSFGLETYVQKKLVHDKESAREFLQTQLCLNIHFTDAALVSLSYDACSNLDDEKIRELDEICEAVKHPFEIRRASTMMGRRLLKLLGPLYHNSFLDQINRLLSEKKLRAHYPVIFGIIAQLTGEDKQKVLNAFYYNAATTMVTNCV